MIRVTGLSRSTKPAGCRWPLMTDVTFRIKAGEIRGDYGALPAPVNPR